MKAVIDYAHSTASLVFPTILGELGIDVVALNAYIDAKKITKTKDEFINSLNQLSDIVMTLRADVGFLFDNGAEKLFLVDERGKIIDNDTAMLIMAYLVMLTYKSGTIAVPVTVSSVIDELAKKFNFKIKRTGTSPRNVMNATKEEDVIFVADCKTSCQRIGSKRNNVINHIFTCHFNRVFYLLVHHNISDSGEDPF